MEQEKKEGKCEWQRWLGRNWWKLLLSIMVSSLIVVYTITRYQLEAPDKYTIFVDLITIILALAGAIGFVVFRLISREVESQLREALREDERVLREGQIYTRVESMANTGLSFYEQYRTLSGLKDYIKNKKKTPSEIDPMRYLNRAIERTTSALELAEELDEKKYERIICICKNNLAYYLAERQKKGKAQPGDKELAKKYAEYVRERMDKYPRLVASLADTCEFVKQQFPNDE